MMENMTAASESTVGERGTFPCGPWDVEYDEGDNGLWSIGDANGNWIADCEDEETANRLAAFPDLYEALANLIPRFERACKAAGSDDEFISEATKDHRAALAKATGTEAPSYGSESQVHREGGPK